MMLCLRGWDEFGEPTEEKLRELGLLSDHRYSTR